MNNETIRINEKNPLDKNWTFGKLILFTLPPILMMIFTSIYTMVDGLFVSNYISDDALGAINIVLPYLAILYSYTIMIAAGGSAIIGTKMGQGRDYEAKSNFSTLTIFGVGIGLLIATVSYVFAKPITHILGSTPILDEYTIPYIKIIALTAPFVFLQVFGSAMFMVSGKMKLGLMSSVIAGLLNIILDYVFIVILDLGIEGAAFGTGIGNIFGASFFVIYFIKNKKGTLTFKRPNWDGKMILKACSNGSSEMVVQLSAAITTFIFNLLMLKFMGEDGVAAISIILYLQFIQVAIISGFSQGVAPVVSFNNGSQNHKMMKRVFKYSVSFIIVTTIIMTSFSILKADFLTDAFLDRANNINLFEETVHGFKIFSLSCIFIGFNIFSSGMFTALSNGRISAIISFLRTLLIQIICLITLPYIFGLDGVWLAVPCSEFISFFVAIYCIKKYGEIYHYI